MYDDRDIKGDVPPRRRYLLHAWRAFTLIVRIIKKKLLSDTFWMMSPFCIQDRHFSLVQLVILHCKASLLQRVVVNGSHLVVSRVQDFPP